MQHSRLKFLGKLFAAGSVCLVFLSLFGVNFALAEDPRGIKDCVLSLDVLAPGKTEPVKSIKQGGTATTLDFPKDAKLADINKHKLQIKVSSASTPNCKALNPSVRITKSNFDTGTNYKYSGDILVPTKFNALALTKTYSLGLTQDQLSKSVAIYLDTSTDNKFPKDAAKTFSTPQLVIFQKEGAFDKGGGGKKDDSGVKYGEGGVYQDQLADGLNINNPSGLKDISGLISKAINFLFLLLAMLATAAIIYAGALLVLNAGDEARVTQAKKVLKMAALGLVLSLSAFAIVNIIQTLLG